MWSIPRLRFPTREFNSAPSDHRPALDGVRGLAILTVFLYDCLKLPEGGAIFFVLRKISSCGWSGVDLFFVLSGFLITGVLIDSRGKPGYLRSFFARRSLRIFPLYFLALWFTFVVVPQLAEYWEPACAVAGDVNELSRDQFWFWTYLQNWRFAFQGHWPEVKYLNHFWSLAVEEQFYLVWPFVVGALASRTLAKVCWSCVALALTLRVGLLLAGAPLLSVYILTPCRLDSLCLGALFALGLRSPIWYPRLTRWVWPMMGLLAAVIVGVDVVWPLLKSEQVGTITIGHTLLAVLFGGFVFSSAAVTPQHWLARVLSSRWLTIPGQYSYAMYVVHRPIYRLVLKLDWSGLSASVQPFAIFAATVLATLGLAALSWKFIERPILSLKSYFPRPGEGAPQASEALTRVPV